MVQWKNIQKAVLCQSWIGSSGPIDRPKWRPGRAERGPTFISSLKSRSQNSFSGLAIGIPAAWQSWRRPSLHCQPMPQRYNTRYKRLDRELSLMYFGFMWDCGEGVGEAQFLLPPSSRPLSFCRHIIWNKLNRHPHLGRSPKFSAHRTL